MNACVQCLSHIPELRTYFINANHEKDLNTTYGMKGQLASDFYELICRLWKPLTKSAMVLRNTSVSPTSFKKTISKWAPQFTGYRQQDSQEFLRFLLDGLHEDLNRVKVKPPYEELVDIEYEMEYDKANRWWNNYISFNNSFISGKCNI
jgi:ubiquitin C-terminal hydrolase